MAGRPYPKGVIEVGNIKTGDRERTRLEEEMGGWVGGRMENMMALSRAKMCVIHLIVDEVTCDL